MHKCLVALLTHNVWGVNTNNLGLEIFEWDSDNVLQSMKEWLLSLLLSLLYKLTKKKFLYL